MAARAAKKKRDIPPLYVTVADGGRLAPAFQHDQERIMSFRKGTRLIVTIDTDGSRRGVRKWHAVIGKAVKNGLLPWVTASAADEAIRLALDLYDPKKSRDGTWHRVTQSLNDLDDAELDEQIELMTGLIVRLSGVDPDDFKREMAGAGDERFKSEYDGPAAANDAGSPTNLPGDTSQASGTLADPTPLGEQSSSVSNPSQDDPQAGAAATTNSVEATNPAITLEAEPDSGSDPTSTLAAAAPISNQENNTPAEGAIPPASSGAQGAIAEGTAATESSGEEEKAAGEGYGAVSLPAAELSTEDRQWLVDGARMMLAAQPEPSAEAKDVLFRQVKGIITLMPKTASADARGRMEQVKQHCISVCKGDVDLDMALVARIAMTTVAEITPAAVKTARAAK